MKTHKNTIDLLNYFINQNKLTYKKNEQIFLNMSDYFINMIENKKDRILFYTELFNFINNLSDIKTINNQLNIIQHDYDKLVKLENTTQTEEELALKALNRMTDKRISDIKNREEKEIEIKNILKQKNTFFNFFNKNFYFLLNNIYYNYKLIRKLFIEFLKLTNNDDFITIIIEHSKRRLNKELLIDIITYYNINKTHVNILISMNINEITILILEIHEDKILRYNEIFNTCFFSSEPDLENLLFKKDNKYIKYISQYLKRNELEANKK